MLEAEQQERFETWLAQYRAMFYKVMQAFAFNQADRDDLFQEICLQVWKSIPAFRGDAAASTWLYRIALNTAITWSQQSRKHNKGHDDIAQHSHHLTQTAPPTDERLAWLYEQIAGFHPVDRSLALLLLDGFSYRDMAHMLGISESNVGVKIHRIKKHLVAKAKNQPSWNSKTSK